MFSWKAPQIMKCNEARTRVGSPTYLYAPAVVLCFTKIAINKLGGGGGRRVKNYFRIILIPTKYIKTMSLKSVEPFWRSVTRYYKHRDTTFVCINYFFLNRSMFNNNKLFLLFYNLYILDDIAVFLINCSIT